MDYVTERRSFGAGDVQRHLDGRISIVAIPLLDDDTCSWGCIDIDARVPCPKSPKSCAVPISWFRSKSGGWHGFVFFGCPKPAAQVIAFLKDLSELLGFAGVEVFPKQASGACGNGVNLPFFGDARGLEGFSPSAWSGQLPDAGPAIQEYACEEGWWTPDALLAMLCTYKKVFAGFDFRQCRGGFAVPCPGHESSWEDDAAHTVKAERLSPDTLVFLQGGKASFRCLHAHCSEPKKTFRDWQGWWDPAGVWTWDDWMDSEIKRRGEWANVG
jgi:hypothetical protein